MAARAVLGLPCRVVLGMVLLAGWCAVGLSAPTERASTALLPETLPNTGQAVAIGFATAQDLARLKSVEGQPQRTVLRVLGHPSVVERRPDGTECWHYPWLASCQVYIKRGICTFTYYTAGF